MSIFIIGHKSPDLDSVAAAISYSNYKNKLEQTDKYLPAVAGDINKETKYILDKYSFGVPAKIENAVGQEFILVDHNEMQQAADGMAEAKIVEILDHHKFDFKCSEPIYITNKPWGSSCSIIADLYQNNKIDIEKNLAGLMLAAILVDTVITKSPTCTEHDKKIIEILAQIAEIADWQAYGMEVFKVRASVNELSAMEIIKSDFKDFEFKQGKFGIGQAETVDLNDFATKEADIIKELDNIKLEGGYHTAILFITDIINEGSKFLVSTDDQARLEEALGAKLENNKVYIPGILSRKKQVTPKLSEVFDK